MYQFVQNHQYCCSCNTVFINKGDKRSPYDVSQLTSVGNKGTSPLSGTIYTLGISHKEKQWNNSVFKSGVQVIKLVIRHVEIQSRCRKR